MLYKNIIIGSGFSSLGAILALQKKNENYLIIAGKANSQKKSKNLIDLPSRNFDKYKNNIYQSLKNNNLSVNIKNNFISYLGFGGLSNIWGKIFNFDIDENNKIKNQLIDILKLKNHTKINIHKNINIYKCFEQDINLKKKFKSLDKKKFIILNSTVEKIKFDIKNKIFKVYLVDQKILKTKKLYLAAGVFSTLKLLRSIDKKIFLKDIELTHSDMYYGIFLKKKKEIIKYIGNEFIYFSNNQKKFAGRFSILNEKIIKKYNLNFFFYVLNKLSDLLGIKIFLLNILFKRPKRSTMIYFKNDIMKIKVNNNKKSKYILNDLRKIFYKSLNIKNLIFKPTPVGSDFHYSCDIKKSLNTVIIRKFYQNLFILDSSINVKHKYFPTFQTIYTAFYRAKNNISLKEIIKR
jgi:hypothetical protein